MLSFPGHRLYKRRNHLRELRVPSLKEGSIGSQLFTEECSLERKFWGPKYPKHGQEGEGCRL